MPTSILQARSTHNTRPESRLYPLCQPRTLKCTKHKANGPAGARPNSRHIVVDSSALEAFLRLYPDELDNTSSSNSSVFPSPNVGRARTWTPDTEDGEDGSTSYLSLANRGHNQSQHSKSLSPSIDRTEHVANFDLLALIPPSALAPYLPQIGLALGLLDVYFTELPSAKLMFDYQSVVCRYRDSTLPHQVLFAILALASLYYQGRSSSGKHDYGTPALKGVHDQGRIWAEIASQMALAKTDTISSLTTVRTCEQLSLYWFAVGQRNRANHHANVSYGLYRNFVGSQSHNEQGVNMSRAVWLHQHFVPDDRSTNRFNLIYPKFDPWTEEDLLLPAGAALGVTPQKGWHDHIPPERYPNTKYAIGTVGLWRQVMALLQQFVDDVEISDASLFQLDSRLRRFYDNLPTIFRTTSLAEFQLAGPARDAKLCFATIHCANVMSLYSPKVQSLSGIVVGDGSDCAKFEGIVVEHATLAGELLHDHIVKFPKNRKIPPMVGYSIFTIGAVHAHMNEFRDGAGWSEAWIHGVSCLLLLEYIASYWPVMGKLSQNLRKRFSYSDPNILTISTELLWQLASYHDVTTPSPKDQYCTGLFRIPYSSSFMHEMLGLAEDSPTMSETGSLHPHVPENRYVDPSNPAKDDAPCAQGDRGGPGRKIQHPDLIMGMIGTDPPTYNFEANLLGLL